jgi:peptidoglycan-N-acetylglucosamine deacetylase
MRALAPALLSILAAVVGLAAPAAAACVPGAGIGLARIVDIDTHSGPLFGFHTGYQRTQSFLKPKEVVLTFDDGPMPWITKSILDTLDANCTKATFFSVGRMAIAYPATTRDVLARGHTLGTHTWSHPLNLKRLKPESAVDEIERGFAAVALAAGQPIAPFFRFPGLNDNAALLTHLQSRGVGIFTVDAISNDSYIVDEAKLVTNTMAQVEARQGGIILFHDIKAATARALPVILGQLKAKGYTVVHMRAASPFEPQAEYTPQLATLLAKAQPVGKGHLVPFYGAALRPGADVAMATLPSDVPVEAIAPEAKVFQARANETGTARSGPKKPLTRTASLAKPTAAATKVAANSTAQRPYRAPQQAFRVAPPTSGWFGTTAGGWVTTVAPPKLRRSAVD